MWEGKFGLRRKQAQQELKSQIFKYCVIHFLWVTPLGCRRVLMHTYQPKSSWISLPQTKLTQGSISSSVEIDSNSFVSSYSRGYYNMLVKKLTAIRKQRNKWSVCQQFKHLSILQTKSKCCFIKTYFRNFTDTVLI